MLRWKLKFFYLFKDKTYQMEEEENLRMVQELEALISDMSASDSQVLMAYYFSQKNCEEIMKEFGYKSRNSVYVRLSQSKRKLLLRIQESNGYELLREYLKKVEGNGKQK